MGMEKDRHHEEILKSRFPSALPLDKQEYYADLQNQPSRRDKSIEHLRNAYKDGDDSQLVEDYIQEAEADAGQEYWYGFKSLADLGRDFEVFRKEVSS
jgi:hypothetical protein